MGIATAIRRFFAPPRRSLDMDQGRVIRGTYDVASTAGTGQNYQHWTAADALDADSANSKMVRERIAQRARYEMANNGQGRGIQLTQANYVVGRGPKLRMQTRSPGFNSMVEAAWKTWATEVKLVRKLRTMIKAKVCDGEAFMIITQNPAMRHPVKLGLRTIECEQVTTPYIGPLEPNKIDGIDFDEYGNPLYYHILKYHPGGNSSGLSPTPEKIPARFVLHLFREDRPGQHRGVSELHPSLNLFAQSRRYREATVVAAENIANFSMFLKTQQSPYEGPDLVRPLSTLPIEKGMMVALPNGYESFQPKAEQPSATYDEFTRSQQREQARPINMPYNIAAADSSGYSFSGGKLDHVTYFVSVDVEQAEIDEQALEPLYPIWFAEAVLRYGWVVPKEPAPLHGWDWPRKPVIDEAKTANARATGLKSGVDSLPLILAEDGRDPEEFLEKTAEFYGITTDELRAKLLAANLGGQSAIGEPGEEEDDEPSAPPATSRAGRNGSNRMASVGRR